MNQILKTDTRKEMRVRILMSLVTWKVQSSVTREVEDSGLQIEPRKQCLMWKQHLIQQLKESKQGWMFLWGNISQSLAFPSSRGKYILIWYADVRYRGLIPNTCGPALGRFQVSRGGVGNRCPQNIPAHPIELLWKKPQFNRNIQLKALLSPVGLKKNP